MSGDAVWVSGDSIFGLGQTVDGLTVATPLGAAATAGAYPEFSWDMVTGLIPGSIGETSVIAIALGVVKNGKVEKPDYQVDGISGGTITSVGVDAMLKTCLNSYKNFLTNNNEEK